MVENLGGTFEQDLTEKSTHLLLTTAGSDKHKAAHRYNISILHVGWIYACFQEKKWVYDQEYTFPLFSGLVFCTTGLYTDERENLVSIIEKHGGTFQPDLEFDTTTHLIAETAVGMKYEAAQEWGIPVVLPDWVLECAEKNAFVNETPFMVQEVKAWTKPTSLMQDCVIYINNIVGQEEIQMVELIRNAMGTRLVTFCKFVTHIVTHTLESRVVEHFRSISPNVKIVDPGWLVNSTIELKPECSYPPMAKEFPSIKQSGLTPSTPALLENHSGVVAPTAMKTPKTSQTRVKHINICENTTYVILFDSISQKEELAQLVQSNHGSSCEIQIDRFMQFLDDETTIDIESFSSNVSRIIIASDISLSPMTVEKLKSKYPEARIGSELWVRCCLADKRAYSRTSHPYFNEACLPISNHLKEMFKHVVASVSGYVTAERAICREILNICGALFTKSLSRKNTHLICKSHEGPKYIKAEKWKLAIFPIEWLFSCVSAGKYLDEIPPKEAGHMTQLEDLVQEMHDMTSLSLDSASIGSKAINRLPPINENAELLCPPRAKKARINSQYFNEAASTQLESQLITYECPIEANRRQQKK